MKPGPVPTQRPSARPPARVQSDPGAKGDVYDKLDQVISFRVTNIFIYESPVGPGYHQGYCPSFG